MVTPEKGFLGCSEVVACPATVPAMLGATGGSVSITVVLSSVAGVASAALVSLREKVVKCDVLG